MEQYCIFTDMLVICMYTHTCMHMLGEAGQKGQLAKGSIPRKISRMCFPTYQQMVSKLGNLKRSAVLSRFSISYALEEVGTTTMMKIKDPIY